MNFWPVPDGPVKLHVGCGPRILRGFINVDLDYEPHYTDYYREEDYPEAMRGSQSELVIYDVRVGRIPLPDESLDLVFHEDFLEHIDQRSQILFLAETHRMLKRGAVHRVNTPNLLSSMRDFSTFTQGAAGVHIGEWDRSHHVSVLTPSMLAEYARMVGYSEVIFNTKNGSISPLVPPEYRPSDRPLDGNLYADLVK